MTDTNEPVYESPQSEPDDTFWLEQGRELVKGSLTAVQEGAKSLMTGLGLLNSVYLGILGFKEFIPKTAELCIKLLFLLPLIFWVSGLYFSIMVLMTKSREIILHSPDDIKKNFDLIIKEKQANLKLAFWMAAAGVTAFLMLVIIRLGL